ncbi:unnamed protein product [Rotaria sp. Silwood2]|nr:unnamed protein product [Rotaria sp. Silwood2]CAF2975056.1 unnamed protein product [Rotaria sp. Silwood2]CAF4137342.1 unnamed protein product [Rotaria sp. Silwood2]CAF4426884.1 unnamed protein product [Rotaria sp. Silwood2]
MSIRSNTLSMNAKSSQKSKKFSMKLYSFEGDEEKATWWNKVINIERTTFEGFNYIETNLMISEISDNGVQRCTMAYVN